MKKKRGRVFIWWWLEFEIWIGARVFAYARVTLFFYDDYDGIYEYLIYD